MKFSYESENCCYQNIKKIMRDGGESEFEWKWMGKYALGNLIRFNRLFMLSDRMGFLIWQNGAIFIGVLAF
jgi:hypothetical protein